MERAEHSWVTGCLLHLVQLAHRWRIDTAPGYSTLYESLYPIYKHLADGGLLRWIARHRAELRGGHFIDAGANLGVVSAQLAKALAGDATLLCLEPELTCFRSLQKKFTNHPGVLPLRLALGETNRPGTLLVHCYHRGDHRLLNAGESTTSVSVPTPVRALDDLLAELAIPAARVRFLKLDLQGGERKALQGMPRLLRDARKLTVCLEFSPTLLRRAGTSPAALLGWIAGFGFTEITRLDARGIEHPFVSGNPRDMAHSGDLLLRKKP